MSKWWGQKEPCHLCQQTTLNYFLLKLPTPTETKKIQYDKNVRAWFSMVSYVKNFRNIIPGSEKIIVLAIWPAKQHNQCYLTGKSQTAPTFCFSSWSTFLKKSLNMKPLRPMPSHFCHTFFSLSWCSRFPSKLLPEKKNLSLGTIFNPLCQKNKWTGDGRYHKNSIFCQGIWVVKLSKRGMQI